VVANAAPVFSLAGTVGLSYGGTDAGSGIANFDVRYRRAAYNVGFGALAYPAAWQHTTAHSVSGTAQRGSAIATFSAPRAGSLTIRTLNAGRVRIGGLALNRT
jgi:hypothetical protein